MTHEDASLRDGMIVRVVQRLGLPCAPPISLDGLRALYQAWGQHVPFDNVRKMIALHSNPGHVLPGRTATDFFSFWLEHGTGGTCWPGSNALFTILSALGFRARRVAGSMRDLGIQNHGTTIVTLDGADWLVDSSLLCNEPLPLNGTEFVIDDPVFPTESESDGDTFVVWHRVPPSQNHTPCRVHPAAVTHDFYMHRYDESGVRSIFNQRLYARRNRGHGIVVLLGSTRFRLTPDGLLARDLDAGELCEALRTDIGLSLQIVEEWRKSGSLAASMEPPEGPPPPPITKLPPSQRRIKP
ncbi:MAG: arylamine N-acetyltransferase [Acidobacteria bacterium]|nr:arylamine N-acetyltransferase [Acidobacteriota bacterium]